MILDTEFELERTILNHTVFDDDGKRRSMHDTPAQLSASSQRCSSDKANHYAHTLMLLKLLVSSKMIGEVQE